MNGLSSVIQNLWLHPHKPEIQKWSVLWSIVTRWFWQYLLCLMWELFFLFLHAARQLQQLGDDGGNIRCGGVVVLLLLYPWQSPPHRRAEHHIVTLAGRMMPLSMEQLDTVLHPTVPAFIHSHWGSMSEQSAFTPPGSGARAACEQTRQNAMK